MGFRGLQPDDYIMLAAFGWYTTLFVCLNVIATGGGSNLFPLEDLSTFTEADIQERIKGSKIVIVSEQAMLNTIYFIKACMLFMYTRLTMGLRQQRIVKAVAIYVACGWLGTELCFFLACRPFNGYWAVPPPDPQCTTLQRYSITQATFNLSSDILMLGIMLPLLVQVNLPFRQKVVLVGIFSLGSFVIVAAVLTKYFNLSDVYSTAYMLWYCRESSTAIYVANLPLIWPLLREWFPYLRKITPGYKSSSTGRKSGTASSTMCGMRRPTNNGTRGSVQMSTIVKTKNSQCTTGTETDIERTGSAERINKPAFEGRGILAETTVDIDIDEGTSDDLDVEKHGNHHPQHHDRMRYEWDRSPTHLRTDTNISGREVVISGGQETDVNDRRVKDVEKEAKRDRIDWRTPQGHGPAEETGYVGRAV
jgi:hypothetical protein